MNDHRIVGWFDRHRAGWLLLGIALIVATQIRAGVGALAWIAPVPWLRYLRIAPGRRARLWFGLALFAAWTAATLKIASQPALVLLAPLFALPIALAQLAAYLTWDAVRPRIGPGLAVAAFAICVALGESLLYSLTPFGSWGATGTAQLDDLPLLQVASVFGVAGVGVIVNLVAASVEHALAGGRRAGRILAVALAVMLAAHAAGTARLAGADLAAGPTTLVAAIATDADVAGAPLPARERTHAWDRVLLARTQQAARGGAAVAVWPEAATLVWPDEEATWLASVAATAQTADIDIVAAYVVPVSAAPFLYRNEYRLVLRDGTVPPPYAKHHPVPGEPAIRGEGPAPVTKRGWGRLSGAICYDYDFPAVARERARAGADLVAVPASDWRGIDPVHAQMAGLRAIESGVSVLRSTRFGLSIAVDPHGRTRAWRSSFEPGSGVMFAVLPATRVPTLYAICGDGPLWIAAAILALAAVLCRAARAAGRLSAR